MKILNKKNSFIIGGLLCISMSFITGGCAKGFLDKKPLNLIPDADVWNSASSIEAYTATLYNQMQTEDLSYVAAANEAGFPSTITDEAVRTYPWGSINELIIPQDAFGWWGYGAIRDVNSFISKLPSGNVEESLKKRYEAEARFIRAFHYFSLAKRYGGVPILTTPQKFTGDNISELQIPRNKEQQVYDFIARECDTVITVLPEAYDAKNTYRATKYAALALKCRAMLYAASIAKNGSVQLNGVIGIPGGDAAKYWQMAYDAAKEIMNSGKFMLYEAADKVGAFQQLFFTKVANSEAIFMKQYLVPDKVHSFDFYNAPQSFKIDYGCAINPTLQMAEEYEYVDGTPGTLKVNDANGKPIRFSNPADLFKNKDPRFLASILYPFAPWQGGVVEIRRGIIDGNKRITSANLTDTYGEGNAKIAITGKDGPLTIQDPTKTGFYIQKYMNPKERVPQGRSDQSWIIFRFGEVLLNYAEAAFELNKKEEALEAINKIRERAGIKQLDAITLDKLRHERFVELAFENHRWWDLKRWRIADKVLNNYQAKALYPWLMWDDKTYIFEKVDAPKFTRTFLPKYYYEIIPAGEITKNPNLIQNPLY